MRPLILTEKDELMCEYRYILKIPFSYAIAERHYKLKLTCWILRLLWRELWRIK